MIRASGVNGDGRTNGITAPSATSQAELLRAVHRGPARRPATSGTWRRTAPPPTSATRSRSRRSTRCLAQPTRPGFTALGSVKANIGHTTTAAGIAGLIKVVLALRHRALPRCPASPRKPQARPVGRPPAGGPRTAPWDPGANGVRVGTVQQLRFQRHQLPCGAGRTARPPRAGAPAGGGPPPGPAVGPDARDARPGRRGPRGGAGARPALEPADIAYTRALGRTHLPVRAALLTGGREELLCSSQVDGRPEHRGCYLADSAGLEEAAGSDAPLVRAAAAYVRGGTPDWAALTAGGRRVTVPTYPFAREHYWITGPSVADHAVAPGTADGRQLPAPTGQSAQEPDRSAGPGGGAGSVAVVRPEDPVATDHRVAGRPMLPGTAALALAADLAGLPYRLSAVRWLRPCELSEPRRLRLAGEESAAAGRSGWRRRTETARTCAASSRR